MKQHIFRFLRYILLLAGILVPLFLLHQNMLKGRTILIPGQYVYVMAVDHEDRIWIRTSDGVTMIENAAVKSFELNSQFLMLPRDKNVLGIDENNQPWVIASTGVRDDPLAIYGFDGKDWVLQKKISDNWPTKNELPCCLPSDKVIASDTQFKEYEVFLEMGPSKRAIFLSDKQGNVWAGTDRGLIRFSPDFHLPPFPLKMLHIFLSSGGYWLLGFTITTFYLATLFKNGNMADIELFFLTKSRAILGSVGYFLLGFAGWLIISAVILVAVLIPFGFDSETIFPVISIVVQLIGLGITILAFRRNRKWIGIGIICVLFLYLIGFVIRGGCMPAGLPFPLSMFPC